MSYLKPGTLCITVGCKTPENSGRIVRILGYVGSLKPDPVMKEPYRICTANGRPFAVIQQFEGFGKYRLVRNQVSECIADRSNLRPLVDPSVDAAKLDHELPIPGATERDVEHELTSAT